MESSIHLLLPALGKLICEALTNKSTVSHSYTDDNIDKERWELELHRSINECDYASVEYWFNKFHYNPSTDLMATAMHTHNIRMINLVMRYVKPERKYIYQLQKCGIAVKNFSVSLVSNVLLIIVSLFLLIVMMLKRL